MSAGEKAWNLYVETFDKEPISAQQLHNYSKETASLDNLNYKTARETFNNNQGKSNTSKNKNESIKDNPALAKYAKMKKIGMPMASILHKMTMDGISKELIAQFSGETPAPAPAPAPVPAPVSTISEKDKKAFSKYDRLKKFGMTEDAIRQKMKMDGINEEDINKYLSSLNWKKEVESKLDEFDDMLAEIDKDIKTKKQENIIITVERIESKERFEERIKTARQKLESDTKQAETLLNLLTQTSGSVTNDMFESICKSFENYAPFSEETLLMAWFGSPQKCEQILLELCEKILKYPIDKNQFEWLNKYIMSSSVWMFESNKEKDKKHMFYYLLDIVEGYCKRIIKSMDKMYKSLQENETDWKELTSIENKKLIDRQDDEKVGLLKEKTILLCQEKIMSTKNCNNQGKSNTTKNKNESIKDNPALAKYSKMKKIGMPMGGILNKMSMDGISKELIAQFSDETQLEDEQLINFIDSQFAINILISTAKKLNDEFQNYMKKVMNENGIFCDAPIKLFDRCKSKVENSDDELLFPKAASLKDIIRCSVTFDTISDLVAGYNCLMDDIKNNSNVLEIAEIKNDFLDDKTNGFRDITINVIFHSIENEQISMITEIKFILNNYLLEKKKLWKLYSILREKDYFEMVVGIDNSIDNNALQQIYNFESDCSESGNYKSWVEQAYVNNKLGVLAVYIYGKHILFFDLKKKKRLKTLTTEYYNGNCCWFKYKNQHYFAAQLTNENEIEIWNVRYKKSKSKYLMGTLSLNKKKHMSIKTNEKEINYFQFDKFNNIILIVNRNEIQKRSLDDISIIISEMKFDENVSVSCMKQLNISKDGNFIALGCGYGKPYFYIIDIKNKKQIKLISKVLKDTYAPVFIKNEKGLVAVGDMKGNIEIWKIDTVTYGRYSTGTSGSSFKIIKEFENGWITGMDSVNNMLAVVCYKNKQFKIFNTKDCQFNVLFTENIEMKPRRINFSNNKKYLTLCGENGERCSVWKLN